MFRKLGTAMLRGLVVVLPIGLTVWLLWWLGSSAESLLRQPILLFLPERYYLPGMGIVAGLVLLLVAGTMVNALIVRRLLASWEALLDRIPVVKTIYGAFRDFTKLLPAGGRRSDLKRVVLASFGEAQVVGFVTEEQVSSKLLGSNHEDLVAVYFPMSYQIGGYTLYLSKDELRETELTVEEGMRLVLIGGVTSQHQAAAGNQ